MKIAILSPHRDDAAFSCCCLMLAALRARCAVTLVNVFTISDYAPFWLDAPETDRVAAVSAHRRAEDEAFIRALAAMAGVSAPMLHDLAWKDAPIRLGIDAEDVALASPPDEQYADLAQDLSWLAACDLVIAPLALGGHRDHCLVRQAASSAIEHGRLAFYEDLPYACYLPADADRSAGAPVELQACDLYLPDGDVDIKSRLARCYGSQIPLSEARRIQDYADSRAGAERYYMAPAILNDLQKALSDKACLKLV